MTTANLAYRWNGVTTRVAMPATGETVNGEPFTVPAGMKVMTIHVPALVGTGATVLLQSLKPSAAVEASQTWTNISVFNLTDGSFTVLDGMVESTTVTLPVSATGGGTLRFVGSEDQSSVPSTIEVFFSRDG